MNHYRPLENQLAEWSQRSDHVVATIIVGSRAQSEAVIDSYSDLDLVIIGTDLEPLARDPSWLGQFGNLWLTHIDFAGRGDPEWMVIFEGGLKVDLLLLQVAQDSQIQAPTLETQYHDLLIRGFRHIYGGGINYPIAEPIRFDSNDTSRRNMSFKDESCLLQCFQVARFTLRNDLWRAHYYLGQLRQDLLAIFEKHAQLCASPPDMNPRDTWYGGRHIESWLDPKLMARIPELFPGFSTQEIAASLITCLDLYESLMSEFTGKLKGFEWPKGHQHFANFIRDLCEGSR